MSIDQPTFSGTSNGTASTKIDNVVGAAHSAIDSAHAAATPAVESVVDNAHRAVDAMSRGLTQTADAVAQKAAGLQTTQDMLASDFRDMVRDKPLVAIGLAAMGGGLLSWWLSR